MWRIQLPLCVCYLDESARAKKDSDPTQISSQRQTVVSPAGNGGVFILDWLALSADLAKGLSTEHVASKWDR